MIKEYFYKVIRYIRYVLSYGMYKDIIEIARFYITGGADVLFYCLFPIHEDWIESTLRSMDDSVRCVLVTAYSSNEKYNCKNVPRYQISRYGMNYLRVKIAISAVTGDRVGVLPQNIAPIRIHMPHSLVSLHMIYPPDSFTNYNVLFCVGSHHVHEVEALNASYYAVEEIAPYEIGYGKLDMFLEECQKYASEKESKRPEVLIAPSWGKGNILETFGQELTDRLVGEEYDVVVRPHPLFFNSSSFLNYMEYYKGHDRVKIENPWEKNKALIQANIMISDYSGIAYEFAFLRRLPVVFIDVQRKVNNPDWGQLGLEPMELELRTIVGTVCAPDVEKVIESVRYIQNEKDKYIEQIRNIEGQYIYNRGRCGVNAARRISRMIHE